MNKMHLNGWNVEGEDGKVTADAAAAAAATARETAETATFSRSPHFLRPSVRPFYLSFIHNEHFPTKVHAQLC